VAEDTTDGDFCPAVMKTVPSPGSDGSRMIPVEAAPHTATTVSRPGCTSAWRSVYLVEVDVLCLVRGVRK